MFMVSGARGGLGGTSGRRGTGMPEASAMLIDDLAKRNQHPFPTVSYEVNSATAILFSEAGQARATIRSSLNTAATGRPAAAAESRSVLIESVGTPGFTSVGSLPSNTNTSRGRPK